MGARAPLPRVFGRQHETDILKRAVDRVTTDRQTIVLVEGEAGVGKSTLLRQTLEDARGRRVRVVAGRAEELEQTRPFGVVAAALGCTGTAQDPDRAAIATMLAHHTTDDAGPVTVTSDPGLRFRVVDACCDLVERLALGGPLMIGLDDLQWADPASLLTLGALSRRLAYLPVALLACFRPTPRTYELVRLTESLRNAGAEHLALEVLDRDAVRDLVADLVAAEPGPGLLHEASAAGGNPLFVSELVAALQQEGAITTADGTADVDEGRLPPTLRLTLLRRLSFLPDGTLTTLRAAAILGSSFSLSDLSATTGQAALDLSVPLRQAVQAGVLADDSGRLRFRHDLIRDCLYDDLPAGIRRGLHREAGRRLAEAGAPVGQVAEHLARGAGPADTEAAAWLERAALEAAPRSPEVAASLQGRALELMPAHDLGRDRLLVERASSLLGAGRVADAETICQELLARHHDPAAEGSARICRGHALLAAGRPREGLDELEQAVQVPEVTGSQRANALGWAAIAHVWLADLDGAEAVAGEARSTAAASGDPLGTSLSLAATALVAQLRGRLEDAREVIDEAVRLADDSPGRQGHLYPVHAPRGFVLVELDRLAEARATLDAGTRISEERGLHWHLPSYQMVRAYERFVAGEWDEAVAEVDVTVDLAAETGETYSLVLARSVLALIELHRNRVTRARELAEVALGQLAETGSRYRGQWASWAHALTLQAEGRSSEATATLAGCWDECMRLGLTLECRSLGADLARLAIANGEPGRARDVAAAVAELAKTDETPSIAAAALHCAGLAEADPELLCAAAAAYGPSPRPLSLAQACEDAGVALAREGDTPQARRFLGRALDGYEDLGAAYDVRRAQSLLRDAGVRRGMRGARGRPQTGWESLTPTEETVASLVVEGLSNPRIGARLFISRRTVQTHLAHIFTKLGISSRAQLAAEVTRHRRDGRDSRLAGNGLAGA